MSRVNGYTRRQPRLGVCSAKERESNNDGQFNICSSSSFSSFIFSSPAFFEIAASSYCRSCAVLANSLRTTIVSRLALSLTRSCIIRSCLFNEMA